MCEFLLAKNGLFRFRFDQELYPVSESENPSPRHPPSCAYSGSGSPFLTHPCRSGWSPPPLFRILVSVYCRGQNDSLAGGNSSVFHHRRRLRSGPPPRMDPEVRRSRHHHQRQRPTIHIFIVGGPLFSSLHLSHSNNCLSSSIKRPRGAFPPPPEGCPPSQSGRSGLVLTSPLGVARVSHIERRGFGIFTVRSSVWFAAHPSRSISVRSGVAVAVVSPGFSRCPGWPHSATDAPPHHTIADCPARGSPVVQVCFGPPGRRPAALVAALRWPLLGA